MTVDTTVDTFNVVLSELVLSELVLSVVFRIVELVVGCVVAVEDMSEVVFVDVMELVLVVVVVELVVLDAVVVTVLTGALTNSHSCANAESRATSIPVRSDESPQSFSV